MKLTFQRLDGQHLRGYAAAHPLQAAVALVMMAGLVVALLFSMGYGVGKDRALADNRADQMQVGR